MKIKVWNVSNEVKYWKKKDSLKTKSNLFGDQIQKTVTAFYQKDQGRE
jgi:hypothetical protein